MSEEERSTEEHRKQAMAWMERVREESEGISYTALAEACYTFSELGLFEDLENIDPKHALRVWAVVETVRRGGFPRNLRM